MLAKGIWMSVPIFKTCVNINVYPTEIINNPTIFAFGLRPFVFFNTSFLKSSINPTIPNPIVTNARGKRFFATSNWLSVL